MPNFLIDSPRRVTGASSQRGIIVAAVALLSLMSASSASEVGNAHVGNAVPPELTQAMATLNSEFQKPDADLALIARFIANDYVHTNGESGEVWDRPRWLAFAAARRQDLATKRWRIDQYLVTDQVVRMHGCCAAVVTFILQSKGIRLDRPYAYQHHITQLWTRDAGQWQRAAYHDSPLSRSASAVDVFAPEREIAALAQNWREAVTKVDLEALDLMSSRDLVYVDAHGVERNKQQYLDHLATENVHYNSSSLQDTQIKVLGELATVTGLFRFDVTVNRHSSVGAQYYTAVYLREDSAWKLLIWQTSAHEDEARRLIR